MVFAANLSSSSLPLRLCIRASALLLKVWGMALLEIQKCKLCTSLWFHVYPVVWMSSAHLLYVVNVFCFTDCGS